ncbi:hypothetical protein SAVIM338S_01088 [Streptomyces avidinii]
MVGRPSRYPWLVTRVSIRSCTGVRERRYPGTAVGPMPSVEAKAAFLEGCADRDRISCSTSQLATFFVPPYRVGEDPLMARVGAFPVADAGCDGTGLCGAGLCGGLLSGGLLSGGGVFGGGLSGGGVACLAAVDGVNGSGPDAAAGCRNTSSPAEVLVPPPPGLVSTTARVTAAASATIVVASRGTDRHQGFDGGSGGTPPGPPGGAGGGGGGGPSRPPDNGPEGGPVGRSDDGGFGGG